MKCVTCIHFELCAYASHQLPFGCDFYKEPVQHGEWISERCNHKPCRIKNPEKWVIYKCSVCGYSNGRKKSNYCPNCGVKMDNPDLLEWDTK